MQHISARNNERRLGDTALPDALDSPWPTMRARISRLAECEEGVRREWARQANHNLLTPEELQAYRLAIWQAWKGLESARLVMERAVERIERAR